MTTICLIPGDGVGHEVIPAAAEVLTGDPVVVVDNPTYRSEEKMLDDWCRDDEVRATLREAIVVLGELLRGFNENIYKSSKSAADCCES